jgi:hypothetical protein
MSVITISSVAFTPDGMATILGDVDGIHGSAIAQQCDINAQTALSDKLNFCALLLKDAVPPQPVIQIGLTGTVTI